MRCRAWERARPALRLPEAGNCVGRRCRDEKGSALAASVMLLPLLATSLLAVADVAAAAANQSRLTLVTSLAARRAAVEIAFGRRDAAVVATAVVRREYPHSEVSVTETSVAGVPLVSVQVRARIPAITGLLPEHELRARSRAPVEMP